MENNKICSKVDTCNSEFCIHKKPHTIMIEQEINSEGVFFFKSELSNNEKISRLRMLSWGKDC